MGVGGEALDVMIAVASWSLPKDVAILSFPFAGCERSRCRSSGCNPRNRQARRRFRACRLLRGHGTSRTTATTTTTTTTTTTGKKNTGSLMAKANQLVHRRVAQQVPTRNDFYSGEDLRDRWDPCDNRRGTWERPCGLADSASPDLMFGGVQSGKRKKKKKGPGK